MIHPALLRRTFSISILVVATPLATVLLPVLLGVALAVDAGWWLATRKKAITTRLVTFAWLYLVGEAAAVAMAGVVGLLGGPRSVTLTYRLQNLWTAWNLYALRLVFSLKLEVDGPDAPRPGPIVVLSRHASLIDSLLPANLIARKHGFRLRYVLKKELLADPALDIAGNRLPNYFVDRKSRESEAELAGIRSLASELTDIDGVVIFPEGTRFSFEKREGIRRRFRNRTGAVADYVAGYEHVLAPRPAGTLTLLEATSCDVVVLAHQGLEGFATVGDIWSGEIVGSTIAVRMWRIPRSEIPTERSERVTWLFKVWAEVDEWASRW